jgi:hypothetical protein
VDVPLDPAPFLVLRRDEALLRRLEVREARPQVLGQPHVPQHQSDLGGEVGDELFLVRIHRVVCLHRQRQRPELFTLVPNLGGEVVRKAVVGVHRPRRHRLQFPVHAQEDARATRTDAFPQDARQARQDLVRVVRVAQPPAELGENLVRRGALPVHHAVGEPPGPCPDGLEDERHDRGRDRREDRAALRSYERADADDDRYVDQRDEPSDDREHDGLADHDIDVVEPVLQYRGADRDRMITKLMMEAAPTQLFHSFDPGSTSRISTRNATA